MPNAARSALDVSSVMTTSSIDSMPLVEDDDADDDEAAAWVATRPALACSRPTRPLIDDEPDADEDDDDELRKVTVAGAPCESNCSIVVCASTRRPPTSARSEARAAIQWSTAACSNNQTQ
jgi:hypothetical protein